MQATTVRDIMTPNPVTMELNTGLIEAAKTMRERDIGDIIVAKGGKACGIVTDRDIVIRVVATGQPLTTARLSDVCSRTIWHVKPDDSVDQAVRTMREHAVRRLPVLDDGKPVGVVSLGDLAVNLDKRSALADISAAPANH